MMANINLCKMIRIHRLFSTLKYQAKKAVPVNNSIFYNTVMDISKYQQFIPWCVKSEITSKKSSFWQAQLCVKFALYKISYVSRVETFKQSIPKPTLIIKSISETEPFRVLESVWRISSLEGISSQVDYKIKFQFSNSLYQQSAKIFLTDIGEKMFQSFVKQAQKRQKQHREVKKNGVQLQFSLILKKHPKILAEYTTDPSFKIAVQTLIAQNSGKVMEQEQFIKKLEKLL